MEEEERKELERKLADIKGRLVACAIGIGLLIYMAVELVG